MSHESANPSSAALTKWSLVLILAALVAHLLPWVQTTVIRSTGGLQTTSITGFQTTYGIASGVLLWTGFLLQVVALIAGLPVTSRKKVHLIVGLCLLAALTCVGLFTTSIYGFQATYEIAVRVLLWTFILWQVIALVVVADLPVTNRGNIHLIVGFSILAALTGLGLLVLPVLLLVGPPEESHFPDPIRSRGWGLGLAGALTWVAFLVNSRNLRTEGRSVSLDGSPSASLMKTGDAQDDGTDTE
jgi:hypothetical protein